MTAHDPGRGEDDWLHQGEPVVLADGVQTPPDRLAAELVALVRSEIGPVASLRRVDVVAALPKTRSGKLLRRTMREIADGGPGTVPSTVEDAGVVEQLRPVLREGRAS